MLLGFKTELKVNNSQRTQLAKHCGVARHAWNWGLALTKNILDHNKANPSDKVKFPTAVDLHKWLVAMVKPEFEWYYQVSKCAPQYALRQLAEAWKQAFKKVKKPPRFKKKGRSDSFTVDGALKIESSRVKVPVIGWLKTYERLPALFQPKSFTISRTADRWYVSWKIEPSTSLRFNAERSRGIEPEPTNEQKSVPVVGVDLGVKVLATLSTGEVMTGAKSYRRYEQKLSRLQYLCRHKQRGSSNWKKAHKKIARLHQKIANIRKDTLHKLTSYLAKNHGRIGIEDLNVSGMLANHQLAKAVADMGFFEFRRQLTYKCELYGSELVVVDRWFPSSKTCSNCGTKKETLSLSERVFECGHCGFTCDRDLNASINLCVAVS